jgi:hypothetical protein
MVRDSVDFRVTRLEARIPPGIPVIWHDREMCSGPLAFDLDDAAGESGGTMDYANGTVSVEFRVRLRPPGLENIFQILNAKHEPLRAILRAQGEILPDHSFAGGLRGRCKVRPSGVFAFEEMDIAVLPGL